MTMRTVLKTRALAVKCLLIALPLASQTISAQEQEKDLNVDAAPAGSDASTAPTESGGLTRVAQADPVLGTQRRSDAALEEVVVRGTRPERYDARTTEIGRFPQEILKIPRTVNVVPEQILLDQQVYDFADAIRNVGGVTEGDGFGGTLTDYFIRGFRRESNHRNGFRLTNSSQPPMQNVESLEIIKGPASVLYGQIEPGGLVNIRTKKPGFDSRVFAQMVFDDYGKRVATLDMTGPLGDGEVFAYRLNGAFERSETFRDFYEIEQEFVSPSILWKMTPDTTAVLTYEYYADNRPLDRGFVSLSDGLGGRFIPDNIPISRRFGESIEERDAVSHLAEASLEHAFSDSWTGTVAVLYRTEDSFDVQVRPVNVNAAGNMVRRVDGSNDRQTDTYATTAWMNGKFATGRIEHQLSLGVDYRDETQDRFLLTGTDIPGFNIFNPVYGTVSDTRPRPGDPRAADETAAGAYIQDHAFLSERFSLLAGARYDQTEGESLALGQITVINKKTHVSPQVALMFQPTAATSVYASYSEGFQPQTTIDPDSGETFDPEEGTQYEIGAKARLFDSRLSVSAAVYDLTKTNIVGLNQAGQLDLVGEVRSRGVELDMGGEILPGFNVLGSYAYTDSEILTETSADRGNVPRSVAPHTFRLWGGYEIRGGRLAGLGMGVGVDHTDDRFGEDNNTWSLGSYTLVDAGLWYYANVSRLHSGMQLRLGLNVKNITDERYFPAAGNALRINIGRPRTIVGSVGVVF